MPGPLTPALFLDRDGVVNRDRPDYVRSLAEFEFLPGALDAFRQLALLEIPIIVVTNQSQIGRGITPAAEVEAINRHMVGQIAARGGRVTAVLVCPHAPGDGCECRKPRPGLLLAAASQYGIDLSASVMVGDRLSDRAAARAAGCRFIMVGEGPDSARPPETSTPEPRAAGLAHAVPLIRDLLSSPGR